MKKMTILKSVIFCSALTLTVTGCKTSNLEAIQVDPYTLGANYRNVRIQGTGYSAEQFTEHSRIVEEGNVTKEQKTYVVEDVKVLVVPVDFTDAPYSWYNDTEDGARAELEKVFFGGPEDMQWYSLAEYYRSSSFGKCNVTGSVAPWWHTGVSYSSIDKEDTSYATRTAGAIRDYYREHNDEINLAQYDANKDGYVDTIVMIYTAPITTTGEVWWAFCSSTGSSTGKYTENGIGLWISLASRV